jgi:hypothetical protein
MPPKKILCIIDMQDVFDPPAKTISNVINLIQMAVEEKWLILNVLYYSDGDLEYG